MKNKPLFIIPMLSPLFITSAQANLPDEINFAPYQRTYEQSASQVDIIDSNLQAAQSELSQAYEQESSLTQMIENLELNIARTNSQIQNHLDERDRLIILSQDLDNEMRRIDTRLSRAEGKRQDLEREVQRERRELKPYNDRLDELQRQLGVANKNVTEANKRLKVLEASKNQTQSALEAARTKVTNLETALSSLESKLTNIDKLIENAQARIVNLEGQVSASTTARDSEQTVLNAINDEIKTLQDELRAAGNPRSPQAIEIRKKLAEKAKQREEQAKKVSRLNQQITALATQVANAKKAKTDLENEKNTLPAQIASTQRQLDAAKTQRQAAKAAFDTAKSNYDVQRTNVENLVVVANAKSAEVNAQKEEIIRRSGPLNAAMSELGQINDRIREIGENLRMVSNQYNATLEKITILDHEIPQLRRDAQAMNRDLRSASNDLITAQDRIIVLNGDVTRLSSDLRSATVDRDLKYQEYITRYEYYMDKLQEAKMLGVSQTDVAINIARTDSDNAVDRRASELGKKIGLDVASAEANYWSAIRAEIKGYNDGYDEGYASDSDQMRGQEEGTRAGIKAAQDYAQSVLKPRYFNDIYADALKNGVMKSIDTVNIKQAATDLIETQNFNKNILDILSDVSPVSSDEVNQSLDIKTDLDNSIATFKNNVGKVYNDKDSYANPANTYEKPASIPTGNANCESVYKGLSIFKNACASEYKSVFTSKYLAEHYDNFAAQYEGIYNSVVSDTRNDNIEALYTSGMNQFYPIAKASGVSDGKDQIYQETFALAKDRAYNNELPKADSVAKAQASNEVNSWVSTNAALTVVKSEILAAELRGGALAKVKLDIKNISPKALVKPVEVEITTSQNAEMTTRKFYIKSADGNTTTAFDGIDFKVATTARSGDIIKIAGQVKLPGGKYEAERVEKFELQAQTAVNPKLSFMGLSYDASPKIKSFFGKRIISLFTTSISPEIEDIKDGYTVSLTPKSGSESLINITQTSFNTGKLSYGNKKDITFKYSFPNAADGKTVELELKYIFNGKVMSSQVIELKPH